MAKKTPLLSVVIPAYNEEATILSVIKTLRKSSIKPMEIIVVDDGSKDMTRSLLQKHKKLIDTLVFRKQNGGKGAALRDGIKKATGKFVVIQDADLEYDPSDLPKLIEPLIDGKADVVYGSRFIGSQAHRVVYFWHYVANMGLTLLSNMTNNINLTDMETGYKMFERSLIQSLDITENSFGIEPEITAKVAQRKARMYEVGISYHGRTYEEGKKITFIDAIRAVWVIFKFGVLMRFV